MLSCKEVTELISRSMDASLPVGERIGVRFHLVICRFCASYKRQLLLIRKAMRRLAASADRPGESAAEKLSEEARDRITKSLRNP